MTVLQTTQQAFHSWANEIEREASIWAKTPGVVALTRELLDGERTPEALLAAPAKDLIQALLRPIIVGKGYQGFVIIGPGNIILTSMRDENAGVVSVLNSQQILLERVWAGEAVVSIPLRSDIPMPDQSGKMAESLPTMFVATPVRNHKGDVIAILAFRIDPGDHFTAIFQRGRIGDTGETYAFNAHGNLISESRFDYQLRQIGLIGPTQRGILNISIHDPGVNLVKGERQASPLGRLPLTLMAQSAISGKSEMNLTGYSDYRGVKVIGAWLWDDDHGFGITTEIDAAEVLEYYHTLQWFFIGFAALASAALIAVAAIFEVGRRRVSRAQERLNAMQRDYQGLFDNAEISIWNEDLSGVQKALEKLRLKGVRDLREYLKKNRKAAGELASLVKVIRVNEATLSLFGAKTRAEALDRIDKSFGPNTIDVFIDGLCAIWHKQKNFRSEAIFQTLDGKEFSAIISFQIPETEQGFHSVPVSFIDITERKQLEEQLRLSQRMEAVGQLTGGLAHDFNNLLASIMNHAQLLLLKLKNADDLHYLPNSIITATQRGAELTHRLLAFSRNQTLQPSSIQLGALCEGMSDLLKSSLGETVEITLISDNKARNVLADPGQVENALLNMAINASHAMPNGGKLVITVENASVTDRKWAERWDGQPGEYVALRVADTGTGIPSELLDHVFEPFFTTKDVGQGSGLGLSMVYGFAQQSGGFSTIDSTEGEGATVTIYLPRAAPGQAVTERHAMDAEIPEARGETILLIEDDTAVRDSTMELLKSLGYTVLVAEDGPGALEFLSKAEPVDLLLSDMTLPGGMNGTYIYKAFRRQWPELKCLFISGYASLPSRSLPEGTELLSKPVTIDELARKIRQALDV